MKNVEKKSSEARTIDFKALSLHLEDLTGDRKQLQEIRGGARLAGGTLACSFCGTSVRLA